MKRWGIFAVFAALMLTAGALFVTVPTASVASQIAAVPTTGGTSDGSGLIDGLASEFGYGSAVSPILADANPSVVSEASHDLALAITGHPDALAAFVVHADGSDTGAWEIAGVSVAAAAVILLGVCAATAGVTVGIGCLGIAVLLAVVGIISAICIVNFLGLCSGNSGVATEQADYLEAALANALTVEGGLVGVLSTEANDTALNPSWLAETVNAMDYAAAEQALSQLPNETFNRYQAVSANGYFSPAAQLAAVTTASTTTMASYTASYLGGIEGLFGNDTLYGDLANAGDGLENITCGFAVGQGAGTLTGAAGLPFGFNTTPIGPNSGQLGVNPYGPACNEGYSPTGGGAQFLGASQLDTFGAINSVCVSCSGYWETVPPVAYFLSGDEVFDFVNQQKLPTDTPDIGQVFCSVNTAPAAHDCVTIWGPPNETIHANHTFPAGGYFANFTFACSPNSESPQYCAGNPEVWNPSAIHYGSGYYDASVYNAESDSFNQVHPTVWASTAVPLAQMFGSATNFNVGLRASSFSGVLTVNGTWEEVDKTVVHDNGPVEICPPSGPTPSTGGYYAGRAGTWGPVSTEAVFGPNFYETDEPTATWGGAIAACGSNTNLAFSRVTAVINQELVAAENVSEAYWSYLHEAGYTNVDQVPPDCLIPSITDSWPVTTNATQLQEMTVSQIEAVYSAYMAELGATFGQPLDEATFCDHTISTQQQLAGTSGLIIHGDIFIPAADCGTPAANETACDEFTHRGHWALQNVSLFVQPSLANITLPVNHTWEAPHDNPTLVLWGKNDSSYDRGVNQTGALTKQVLANLTFVPEGFQSPFAGNSTSPNGSIYPTDTNPSYGAGDALYVTGCWVRVAEAGHPNGTWLPANATRACEASIQVLKTRATLYPCLILGECATSPPTPIPSPNDLCSSVWVSWLAGPLSDLLGAIWGPLKAFGCPLALLIIVVVGIVVILAIFRRLTRGSG